MHSCTAWRHTCIGRSDVAERAVGTGGRGAQSQLTAPDQEQCMVKQTALASLPIHCRQGMCRLWGAWGVTYCRMSCCQTHKG